MIDLRLRYKLCVLSVESSVNGISVQIKELRESPAF